LSQEGQKGKSAREKTLNLDVVPSGNTAEHISRSSNQSDGRLSCLRSDPFNHSGRNSEPCPRRLSPIPKGHKKPELV